MQEYKVESFNLDHTKVVAPYIRVADRKEWQGVTVTKFDIRFTQPNKEFLDPAAIHSLEHLLAEELRHQVDNIIDLSPMGCRTGFYLTVFGKHDPEWAEHTLRKALEEALLSREIPAKNETQCGNAALHNLEGARKAIKEFIAHSRTKLLDPFGNGS